MSIVIRVLQSSLAASRSHLSRLVNQKLFMTGQLLQANNREEYKNVLTAAQDSAAVQLLLEACLETEDDQVSLLFFKEYTLFKWLVIRSLQSNFVRPGKN